MIKPDGIQRSFIGEIIQRIERTGLKFVSMKMTVPTREQCLKHYNKDDAWFLLKGERIIKDRQANNIEVTKSDIEYALYSAEDAKESYEGRIDQRADGLHAESAQSE